MLNLSSMDLHGLNETSIFIRLFLAVIFGGILGFERGAKRRPAGFRTYILVSIGAALAMITNQYICETFQTSDPARMGAQVISGIGFLGAGTIIITGRQQVKGLTTAAGLWASACMGLAIGIGFYSGAIMGCLFILLSMTVLHKLDSIMQSKTRIMDLYIQFVDAQNVGPFLNHLKEQDILVSDMQVHRAKGNGEEGMILFMTIKMKYRMSHSEIIHNLSKAEGINQIEEI